MRHGKVYIESDYLDILIASADEVYPKETRGVLMGRGYRSGISLRKAYTFQNEKRTESSAEHRDESAAFSAMRTLGVLDGNPVGLFHTHTYPCPGKLPDDDGVSDYDIDVSWAHAKWLRERTNLDVDKWLELVLSIKKRRWKEEGETGLFIPDYSDGKLLSVRVTPYTGYDFRICGAWIEGKNKAKEAKIKLPIL